VASLATVSLKAAPRLEACWHSEDGALNDWLAWGSEIWLWFRQLLVDYNFVMTRDNTVPTIANVVGYISVIIIGIWGYRAVEKRLRKEHTVDILLRLWITPDFAQGLHILDNHIAKDLFVVENRLQEDDGVGNSKSLDMLLNFYEFIAATYRKSYLDKVVIENQNIKHIHDSFIVLEELINERRYKWDRPSYMKEFEWLARRFGPKMKNVLSTTSDPLTREKMVRKEHNVDRVFVKPKPDLKVAA
jgi:hypothetical protein